MLCQPLMRLGPHWFSISALYPRDNWAAQGIDKYTRLWPVTASWMSKILLMNGYRPRIEPRYSNCTLKYVEIWICATSKPAVTKVGLFT